MQPSPIEIQREVEALRDIRRRSTTQGGPGSLTLDPDLPHESSPTSPNNGYWTASSTPGLTDGDSSSSSHEDASSSERPATDDPFHLFWVPARLHPEIAPTEFRAFLKEHARGPPPENTGNLSRSTSVSSNSSLGRKSSMLSRQYRPTESDGVENEEVVPLRRNRTSIYHNGPQLTINDLQRLDELAEEASASDDPTKLRSLLRRSLSLNVAPSSASEKSWTPLNFLINGLLQLWTQWMICQTQARTPMLPSSFHVLDRFFGEQHVRKSVNLDCQVTVVAIGSVRHGVVDVQLPSTNARLRPVMYLQMNTVNWLTQKNRGVYSLGRVCRMSLWALADLARIVRTAKKHLPFLMRM